MYRSQSFDCRISQYSILLVFQNTAHLPVWYLFLHELVFSEITLLAKTTDLISKKKNPECQTGITKVEIIVVLYSFYTNACTSEESSDRKQITIWTTKCYETLSDIRTGLFLNIPRRQPNSDLLLLLVLWILASPYAVAVFSLSRIYFVIIRLFIVCVISESYLFA